MKHMESKIQESYDAFDAAMTRLEKENATLTATVSRLTREVEEFRKPWDCDKELPEDAAIHAAHPCENESEDSHRIYMESMRLVGARHSKFGLVNLVHWLLMRLETGVPEYPAWPDLYEAMHKNEAENVKDINELRARVQALEAAQAWQPIETAPKDGQQRIIIAKFNDGELFDLDFDALLEKESESWEMPQEYYVWKTAWGRIEEPTHWMPQPLPPTP